MTPPRSSQICRSKKPPPGDTKEGPKPYSLNDIHLFMLGTAGMRDLGRTDRVKQSDLERTINTYLEGTPYKKEDPPYKTITGEEEAAFGWISANFLLGTFSELGQTSSSQTRGYLEMGGASAQIAFRPHANELAPWDLQHGDITRVQLGGVDFNLFLRTYDLGSNTAWREYQLDLIQDATRVRVTLSFFRIDLSTDFPYRMGRISIPIPIARMDVSGHTPTNSVPRSSGVQASSMPPTLHERSPKCSIDLLHPSILEVHVFSTRT